MPSQEIRRVLLELDLIGEKLRIAKPRFQRCLDVLRGKRARL